MSFGGGGDTRVKEPRSQAALAEQAATAARRYGEIVIPVRNAFMAETMGMLENEQNFTAAAGEASTRASGIYEQGMDDFNRAAFSKGYDPGSGAYEGQSNAIRTAQARGMGGAMGDAGMATTDMALGRMMGTTLEGQGLQSDTLQGNAALAASQTAMLGAEAQDAYNQSSALQTVIGTGIGMGAGYVLPGTGQQRNA